jgi:phosphoglycolate phosphatase
MPCKLVIFDFDGTLADTFPWFMRIINDVADRYRFKRIVPHEVELLRGMGATEIMAHLGVPRWKLPLIAGHMRRRKAREIGETKLFAGVEALLARLKDAGVGMAIVSSNSEANVRAVMRHFATRRHLHRRRGPRSGRRPPRRDRLRGRRLGLHPGRRVAGPGA